MLIDLGCGEMPFRQFIDNRVTVYHSLDLYPRNSSVTYVGDIQNMTMIKEQTYDSAICLEVLEHIADPSQALREISRILKPDGILILSVPHLSRLHDEPDDYYRFTRYGLQRLLERGSFSVLALKKRGGLFSFVGHQVSTVVLGIVWGIPILQSIAWFLNSWLITRTCYQIDEWLDPTGIFAAGYSAVACRGGESGAKSDSSRREESR